MDPGEIIGDGVDIMPAVEMDADGAILDHVELPATSPSYVEPAADAVAPQSVLDEVTDLAEMEAKFRD